MISNAISRVAKRVLGLVLCGLMVAACSRTPDSAFAPGRGHDPWVFRSVLDDKPRMISVALAKDFWAAYHAEESALYKVWREDPKLDAAVYTGSHGPQPTSPVASYLLDSGLSSAWVVIGGDGSERPAEARFLGYRFKNGGVYIRTRIASAAGDVLVVEERPEPARKGRKIGLERRFRIVEGDQALKLSFTATLADGAEISSTGALSSTPRDGGAQDIALTIAPRGDTKLTTVFDPLPPAPPAEEAKEGSAHPGEALIAGSDCASCHNPTERTVGPSWAEIRARYKADGPTISMLAQKIIGGGAGAWGEAAMAAHPDLPVKDAEQMAAFIMGVEDPAILKVVEGFFDSPIAANAPAGLAPGVVVSMYDLGGPVDGFPVLSETALPNHRMVARALALGPSAWTKAMDTYGPFNEKGHFLLRAEGVLIAPRSGDYRFNAYDTGMKRLTIDGIRVLDEAGTDNTIQLKAGPHRFVFERVMGDEPTEIWFHWGRPGLDTLLVVPPSAFFHDPKRTAGPLGQGPQQFAVMPPLTIPGDRSKLDAAHPSFRLSQARPDDFEPRVGGLDFLPDGRAVVSTWDADGAVYVVDGVGTGDPARMTMKKVAAGLAEPLGLKVVDGEIYVMQKQELTQLVDNDGDGVTDEYRAVAYDWNVTTNFHEFGFGLDYRDGYFHAALASAVLPGGEVDPVQGKGRGSLVRISRETGAVEFIAHGFRAPNGVGRGIDDALYVLDNEGNWLPSSKLVRFENGAFYGFRGVDPEGDARKQVTPPVVWLPHYEIGNSPSQPVPLNIGPYKNQMLHGDVHHGGLKRVSGEMIDGRMQGCVYRFSQGFEAGVNRLAWGPDGALYVGGIGVGGNWGVPGLKNFGLQRLAFEESRAFEMLEAKIRREGVEITFTEPVASTERIEPEEIELRQWRYEPTALYGGPKVGDRALKVREVRLSEDRTRAFIAADGITAGELVYLRFAAPPVSAAGRAMWSTETWCTVHALPLSDLAAKLPPQLTGAALSSAEIAAGFGPLFAGNREQTPAGGKIVSDARAEAFELVFDWRVNPGGSGVIRYFAKDETRELGMPLIDDEGEPLGAMPMRRSGALAGILPPALTATRPAGAWNHARIVVRHGRIEHWLNGRRVLDTAYGDDAWRTLIAGSAIGQQSSASTGRRFAVEGQGLAVRNAKIRPL